MKAEKGINPIFVRPGYEKGRCPNAVVYLRDTPTMDWIPVSEGDIRVFKFGQRQDSCTIHAGSSRITFGCTARASNYTSTLCDQALAFPWRFGRCGAFLLSITAYSFHVSPQCPPTMGNKSPRRPTQGNNSSNTHKQTTCCCCNGDLGSRWRKNRVNAPMRIAFQLSEANLLPKPGCRILLFPPRDLNLNWSHRWQLALDP